MPKRFGESVTNSEHMRPSFLVQFLKIGCVAFGNDQQVTGIYRSGVHKSEDALVLEDEVGGHAASNYLAKEAVILVRGLRGILPAMPSGPQRPPDSSERSANRVPFRRHRILP